MGPELLLINCKVVIGYAFLREANPKPKRPAANKAKIEGSGTLSGGGDSDEVATIVPEMPKLISTVPPGA